MKIREITESVAYRLLKEYSREITAKNLAPKLVAALAKDSGDVANLGQFKTHLAKLKGEQPDEFATNKIAEGVLAAIESKDPTKNKQYTQWLARMYANGGVKLEDLNRNNVLGAFDMGKRRKMIGGEHADINRFKTYRDFERAIVDNYDLDKILDTDRGGLPKGESKEVFSDGNVRIVVPEDKAAACYYGQGTTWCTAATQGYNYFDRYHNEGSLYILMPKSPKYEGEKYQLHFSSGQFMNEEDEPVDVVELLQDRFPGTIEFFKENEPEISNMIVFADDDVITGLSEKIRDTASEKIWDEISDWQSQDDYFTQWQAEQAEELGYVDDEGDVDWDRVQEDDSLNDYLNYNDDARRWMDDMEEGIMTSPDAIRDLAATMGMNDGETLMVSKLEEVIAQNLRDEYGDNGDMIADYIDKNIMIRKTDGVWKVMRRSYKGDWVEA